MACVQTKLLSYSSIAGLGTNDIIESFERASAKYGSPLRLQLSDIRQNSFAQELIDLMIVRKRLVINTFKHNGQNQLPQLLNMPDYELPNWGELQLDYERVNFVVPPDVHMSDDEAAQVLRHTIACSPHDRYRSHGSTIRLLFSRLTTNSRSSLASYSQSNLFQQQCACGRASDCVHEPNDELRASLQIAFRLFVLYHRTSDASNSIS